MTVAQADLTADNAAVEIDRLIGVALLEHRPVYLMLPSDVAQAPLSAKPAPLMLRQAKLSRSALQAFIAAAREKLLPARRVSLLADFGRSLRCRSGAGRVAAGGRHSARYAAAWQRRAG